VESTDGWPALEWRHRLRVGNWRHDRGGGVALVVVPGQGKDGEPVEGKKDEEADGLEQGELWHNVRGLLE
jgi:hypothetical protein